MSMKRKIEESLRRTAQRLPQPDLEEMMNAPTERMEQHDYITKQEAQKKRPMTRRLVRRAYAPVWRSLRRSVFLPVMARWVR